MMSVLRVLVMTALFAILAGHEGRGFAGTAPPVGESQVPFWSDWWLNELMRQSAPMPQLLYVESLHQKEKTDLMKLEETDGRLNVTVGFKTIYPSGYGCQHEWHQANAGWITTEALSLPPGFVHISDVQFGACLAILKYDGTLPTLHLKPPGENRPRFFWLKKLRAPATIRPAVFSEAQFADEDRLRVSIPKPPSECAGDLMWGYPFFHGDYCR